MTLNSSRIADPKYAPQRRYARTNKGKVAANKARMKRYVKLANNKVTCMCGSTYNGYHKARHCRTKRHQRAVQAAVAELEGSVPVQQRPVGSVPSSVGLRRSTII